MSDPNKAPPAEIDNKISGLPEAEVTRMTDDIVAALKTVYDPEIPADIYELGLIYKVDIEDDRSVKIDMTLTTPNCRRWSRTQWPPFPASPAPRSASSGSRRGTKAG